MYKYETLKIEVDDRGVMSLLLNRPEKKNAISSTMISELTDASEKIDFDKNVRVVVLGGVGDIFCAGGDLNWMKSQVDNDRPGRIIEARRLAFMLRSLNELRCPLIGAVHGGAFGGGVGLACVCDAVVAESSAKFGLTEARLGLIPATISPYVVSRIGEGKSRQFFMSANIFPADYALSLGLIAAHVSKPDMNKRIEEEISPYLMAAPEAVAASKRLIRSLGTRIDDSVIEDTVNRLADTWEGEEAATGIEAFLNKSRFPWGSK